MWRKLNCKPVLPDTETKYNPINEIDGWSKIWLWKKIKQNKSDDKGGLMSEDLSQVEKTSEV